MEPAPRPVDPEELLPHAGWLRAIARNLIRDADLADDVVQQAFVAAIELPPRDGVPIRAWLARVGRNISINTLRATSRRRAHETAVPAGPSPDSPGEAVARAEAMRVVFDAVMALDPPLRDVILARFFDELDWSATAHRLGIPVETARTRMKRAIALLRERLDRNFGSRSAWALVLSRWDRVTPATRVAPHISAPSVATSAAGGTVMGLAVKLSAAAAVVLAATIGWWAVRDDGTSRSGPTGPVAMTTREAPAESARARAKRPGAPDALESPSSTIDLPPPIDLDRCDRDLDLFGRVVDELGEPVPGADVAATTNPWNCLGVWRERSEYVEGPAARTARDGTFALRLVRGACVDLRVRAAGFGEVIRENCLAGERTTVVLPRGASLVVTTMDESGAPVADVQVRVWRALGGTQQFVPIRQQFDTTTGADGVARVGGLAAGSVQVRLQHATLGSPGWSLVDVPAAGEVPLRVTIPVGRSVGGRVIDSAGRAVPGARVGANWTLDRAVPVDAEGRYEFRGWSEKGTTILTAEAPGFVARWKRVPDSGAVDFVLDAGARATGRVTGPDGSAVGGAYVVARSSGGEDRASLTRTVRTDSDGGFALDGLDPGRVHTLAVAAKGLGRVVLDFDAPGAAALPLDLGDVHLGVARAVEGLVTDGDGTPLADVAVSLRGANDDRGRAHGAALGEVLPVAESRRTDDLGRFRFPDVAPGSYEVSPFLMDAPRVPGVRVVVTPDRDAFDVRVALPGSRRLVVRVVDERGDAVPGVSVQLNGAFGTDGRGARQPVMLYTNAEGLATARGLPAAETSVFVSPVGKSDFLYESVPSLVPDGSEVRVVLRRSVEVRGAARDDEGRPVPGIYIEAKWGGDRPGSQAATCDAEGRFAVKVPAGVIASLAANGMQTRSDGATQQMISTPWRGSVASVTGPADDIVIRLTRNAPAGDQSLTVAVFDSAGAPMVGASVAAYGRTPGARAAAVSGTDGRGLLEALPAEEVRVYVSRPRTADGSLPRLELPPVVAVIDLATSGDRTMTLRFRAAVPIRGRVLDADGKPIAGIPVNVSTADGASASVRADADGRFIAPGLPGQVHELSCERWRSATDILRGSAAGVVPENVGGADGVVLKVLPPAR